MMRDLLRRERRLIQNDPTLLEYSVSLHTNDTSFSGLASALQGNTHLSRLVLSFMWTKPPWTDKSVQALASAIAQTKITQLAIECGTINGLHLARVVLLLKEAVQKSPTIVDLELSWIPYDVAMTVLKDCVPKLRSLILSWSAFTVHSVSQLSERLSQTSTLTKLCISDTHFSATLLQVISRGLANNTSIKTLILDRCNIDDDGVESFVEHWRPNSPLCTLEFPNNHIGKQGALMLIQAISNHPTMKHLNLNRNTDIGIEGLTAIALEIPLLALTELRIVNCYHPYSYERASLKKNCKMIGRLCLQGMATNQHLHVLDVSENHFFNNDDSDSDSDSDSEDDNDDDGSNAANSGQELEYYLMRNRYTQFLLAPPEGGQETSYMPPPTIWCHVFAKHACNANIVYHFLKEQPVLWPRKCNDEMGKPKTTTDVTNKRKQRKNCKRNDWERHSKRRKNTSVIL